MAGRNYCGRQALRTIDGYEAMHLNPKRINPLATEGRCDRTTPVHSYSFWHRCIIQTAATDRPHVPAAIFNTSRCSGSRSDLHRRPVRGKPVSRWSLLKLGTPAWVRRVSSYEERNCPSRCPEPVSLRVPCYGFASIFSSESRAHPYASTPRFIIIIIITIASRWR
jgi:hypothetical protein